MFTQESSRDILVKMGNIEEECEDAVFEICDIREQYPAHCAKKLAQCLRITNEINTMNIKVDSIHMNSLVVPLKETDEKDAVLGKFRSSSSKADLNFGRSSKKMLENLKNLIAVAQELRNEDYCEINNCLKKIDSSRNQNRKQFLEKK